ncbi:SusC/RagA family TonB-linked outer membrane protein [Marivirga sp.]|uniref:SusC/RagA family TonB-linked outer membrane protein n=1 Tax=Marivirga sp. TaxID=2018662 RepID=UPI0025FA25CD|nr:SusC/RagA family TonB-linked outer membrane protein [Marivirga sp.]
MKTTFYLFMMSICMLCYSGVQAQTRTVSGTVTEASSGQTLPGVNVTVKGTSTGTTTDFDGNYKLSVDQDDVLEFSFIGYTKQSIEVGSKSVIDVILQENIGQLDEVVVTALGFETDGDEVGYANSQVDNETIVKAAEPNLLNSLSGKASGLSISRNSGDPGAGAFIQIRGANTILGDGQPLIIVDGVPISNDNRGTNQIAQQSRLNDINPNDIKNVSILKGASAAALWGTSALNGAIVITTKNGNYNQELKVSVKSTYSLDQINRRYPIQTRFGQGSNGVWESGTRSSWGDKISERPGGPDELDTSGEYFVDQDGRTYYPITSKNSTETFADENFDQVFQNGHFLENNVSLSAGDETGKVFFSVSNLDQEGIIKNNSDYNRTTARFNGEKLLNNYFTFNANIAYTKTNSNRIRRGAQSSGLYLGLLRTAPDFNNVGYRGTYYPNQDAAGIPNGHRSYRNPLGSGNAGYNNPLWTINEQADIALVDRFLNNFKLTYAPLKGLEFIARAGLDTYAEERTQFFTPGSAAGGFRTGLFEKSLSRNTIFNTDLIGRATRDINSQLNASLLVGLNYNQRTRTFAGSEIRNFIQFADVESGTRDIDNATPENRSVSISTEERRKAAFYSELTLDAFDQLFVTGTIRGESSSTFGSQTDPTFWFPSVNVAWQFTDYIDLDFFSFGKLRASYGEVGREPDEYRTNNEIVQPNFNDGLGGSLNTAQFGNGGFTQSVLLGNPFLGPERKKEFEVGMDLRFLEDKLSLNATFYNNKTEDLFLFLPIANTRGYDRIFANAADIQNEGVEIDLGYELLNTKDFYLSTNFIYFQNENLVTDLVGVETVGLGGLSAVNARVIEGQPFGVLFGSRTLRDESGNIVFDENGFPEQDQTDGVIGDPNPDWRGSFITNFNYKNFGLSVLFETFQGADMYAGTKSVLYDLGTWGASATETTTNQNLLDYNGDVIPAGTTFRGVVKDFGAGPVALTQDWYEGDGGFFGGGNDELYIEDRSWTRLRRIELSYTLSSPWIKDNGFESIQLSATGRNLILWTDFEGNDPDTNLEGVSNAQGIDYFNNPSTKSYVFSVQLNF